MTASRPYLRRVKVISDRNRPEVVRANLRIELPTRHRLYCLPYVSLASASIPII